MASTSAGNGAQAIADVLNRVKRDPEDDASSSSSSSKEIYGCEVCSKGLLTLKSYLKHVRHHTPDELKDLWHRCMICQQFFPTDFDRQSHGIKCHSKVLRTIKCMYCPMESLSNREFFSHAHDEHSEVIRKDWVPCPRCDEYRPSKISRNVHMKSSHKIDQDEPPLVLKREFKQIKCKHCPVILSTKEEYSQHLEVSHQQPTSTTTSSSLTIEPVRSSSSSSSTLSKTECEFCLHVQVFPNKRRYLEHARSEHLMEVQQSWIRCSDCQRYHPMGWTGSQHDCPMVLELHTCPICRLNFQPEDKFYSHMTDIHVDYIEQHWLPCDECSQRRPSKLLLVQHKLSHLHQDAPSGLKIKILPGKSLLQNNDEDNNILKDEQPDNMLINLEPQVILTQDGPQIDPTEIKDYTCPMCDRKSRGTVHNHFQHARACLIQKHSNLVCPYCPTKKNSGKAAFAHHSDAEHNVVISDLTCIWCGLKFARIEALYMHHFKCSPKLEESDFVLCDHCPTIFFFPNLDANVFFIGHMNNDHRRELTYAWQRLCPHCKYRLPNEAAAMAHSAICYAHHPDMVVKTAYAKRVAEKKAPIVNPNLFNKTTERVFHMKCGLCVKAVSGEKKKLFNYYLLLLITTYYGLSSGVFFLGGGDTFKP
jgi:hypothetical protein